MFQEDIIPPQRLFPSFGDVSATLFTSRTPHCLEMLYCRAGPFVVRWTVTHRMCRVSICTTDWANELPELGAFDDISHWVFEPMSHVFALSFTVGATKDAASLDSVFLSHILIVILNVHQWSDSGILSRHCRGMIVFGVDWQG